MIDETVKELATEIKISVHELLQQFSKSGIKKNENDTISKKEKETLLLYLNNQKGTINNKNNKIALKRKKRTTLNILSSNGKNKSVKIEIRKKIFYINKLKLDIKNINSDSKKSDIKNVNPDSKKSDIKNINSNLKNVNSDSKKSDIKNVNPDSKKSDIKNINSNLKNVNSDSKKSEKLKNNEKNRKKSNINYRKKIQEKDKIINKKNKYWKKNYQFNYEKNFNQNSHIHVRLKNEKNKKENNFIKINKKYKKNENIKKIQIEKRKIEINEKRKNFKQKKNNPLQQIFIKPTSKINRKITIGKRISVFDLANQMALKSSNLIRIMKNMGVEGKVNQFLDQEIAQIIAEEMGHKVILKNKDQIEELLLKKHDHKSKNLESRAPIVTIMGHVDHGKTSLLDYIRSSKITKKEFGGITQKIGAYHVKTKKGAITFLDTPGHEAFTAMRSRGTKITDIVVLVIAADDGVMPQTIEAIQHAKLANVPIIVAINKIDKQKNNLENIKNELSKYDILSEEWGGENQFVNISVKKGIGIDNLLELILLQSEILELKSVKNCMAKGVVIESYLDKGKGPIATILIQEGTLRKGDIILCGLEYGHVRAMRNEFKKELQKAGPSIPLEIIGLSNVPLVGDTAIVLSSEKQAKEVSFYRKEKFKEKKLKNQNKLNLKNIFNNNKKNNLFELNIILKTDTQGSREAILDSLKKISNKEVKIKIIFSGVGSVIESDITLALASNSIIIGFQVYPNNISKNIIKNEKLNFRYYSVIYKLINDIKKIAKKNFKNKEKQKKIGAAEVRNIFRCNSISVIAGCIVVDGIIKKNCSIKVFRNNKIIYEGFPKSIRRFKDDVEEVKKGIECGIFIKKFNNIKVGDLVKFFKILKK